MNIAQLLADRSRDLGDRPAIIDDSDRVARQITFREFELSCGRVEKAMAQLGLRPGDPVLVLEPPSIDLCLVLVALLRRGMPVVFIDPGAGLAHLADACRAARPKALVGCRRAHWLRFICAPLRQIPIRLLTASMIRRAEHEIKTSSATAPPLDLPPSAPAIIRFTSGSTGVPKPVVRTHGFLGRQLAALESHLGLAPGQSDLVTMPMFLLSNLATGVTSIIPAVDVRAPGRIDTRGFERQITRRHPSRLAASPALLRRLADDALARNLAFPSLTRIDTGGAPVLPGLLDDLAMIAPHAAIHAVYGSTEAEPIAVLRREDLSNADRIATASGAGLLAGVPVAGITVQLIRESTPPLNHKIDESEFRRLLVPPDHPGEIIVSGPHVHPGQDNDPSSEPTKIFTPSTTWHRTGDTGRLDAQGRLWLLGRTSARIVDDRGTLHPFVIEAAIRSAPRIRQAAVISWAGRRLLAVETTTPSDPPAVPEWIHSHIDTVRFLHRIPLDRRHNAKVDYPALRHLLTKA